MKKERKKRVSDESSGKEKWESGDLIDGEDGAVRLRAEYE